MYFFPVSKVGSKVMCIVLEAQPGRTKLHGHNSMGQQKCQCTDSTVSDISCIVMLSVISVIHSGT